MNEDEVRNQFAALERVRRSMKRICITFWPLGNIARAAKGSRRVLCHGRHFD